MEIYRPPNANPTVTGLYQVARMIEVPDPSRLSHGVLVDSWNCGQAWVWPIGCDPEEPDPSPKGTERPELPDPFTGDVIGADDDCGAVVPAGEASQRAQQTLRLQEQVRVETQLVPRLLAAAGTPTTATGLVTAVGELEETIAPYGFAGVIHAPAHLAAALQAAHLITNAQGGQRLSPLGHRWAFGPGYSALGETLVATGPVTVHRSTITPTHGPDYPHNERLTVIEREVVVTWECWAEAITIEE